MTTTPTTEPPAIPASVLSQAMDIERMIRNHPDLFREGVSLTFGSTQLSIRWPAYTCTQSELRAVVLAHPGAGWKPVARDHSPDLDYIGEIDGVKVTLPRVESVPLTKLPALVDLEAVAREQARTEELNAKGNTP